MPWIVASFVAALAGIFAYRTIVPRTRRRRQYDAGTVSSDWLAHHRHPPEN